MLKENYSLKNLNTFGIDCYARWFAEYASADELREIVSSDLYGHSSSLLIGRGSNLLFLNDFEGIVLHSAIRSVKLIGHDKSSVMLEVGSGVQWDDLVENCVRNGWWGIENLSLIPGEVGAAAVQNIGAYGVELADVVESVKIFNLSTGQEITLSVDDCSYDYRSSIFKTTARNQFAILSVRLRLSREPKPCFNYPHLEAEVLKRGEVDIATIRRTIIEIRTAKLPDPEVLGNAGSFFMNPLVSTTKLEELQQQFPLIPSYPAGNHLVKIPAAWLIDQCGWKGKSMGNAGVYAQQPLVLVNQGGATGKEIAELAAAIQATVAKQFDISLVPEVNYIG